MIDLQKLADAFSDYGMPSKLQSSSLVVEVVGRFVTITSDGTALDYWGGNCLCVIEDDGNAAAQATRVIETTGPLVCIIRRRFTVEDDGHGGSVDETTSTDRDWFRCDDEEEAAEKIAREGLVWDEGSSWASNPDGSHTVDYGTGEEEETSAHLYGWSVDQGDRIRAL